MLRLYEGEVLNKLPVVQHIMFGTLLRCTWTPSSTMTLPIPPSSSTTSLPMSSFPGAPTFSSTVAGHVSGVAHHGLISSLPFSSHHFPFCLFLGGHVVNEFATAAPWARK